MPLLFEKSRVLNQAMMELVVMFVVIRSIGAKVLIDDNPRYALECAEVVVRVLLFDYENAYPWCATGSNRHPLVTGKKLNTIRILDVFIVSIA